MSPQKALEIVREAVIAANPEIMQLGFGCEVAIPELGVCVVTQEMRFDNFQLVPVSKELLPLAQGNVFIYYFSREALSTLPILGRPIRLADVLLAMEEKGLRLWYYETEKNFPNRIVGDVLAHWKLIKDDLSLQSEETIEFLASLLQSK